MRDLLRRFPVLYYAAGVPRAVWQTIKHRSIKTLLFAPPGHFYSPLPSLRDYRQTDPPAHLVGIEIDAGAQSAFRERIVAHSFEPDRYPTDSRYFNRCDAETLYGVMMEMKPERVIEIGSGHSTAVMLDAGAQSLVCVEPYPDRLRSILRDGDSLTIIEQPLESIDLDLFDQLEAGDVLFVDSTHVAKVGSDVNRILFEILPRLASGVVVHIHDMFWPFDYPEEWIRAGRAWNEAYMVRAFLHENPRWEILLFTSYLHHLGKSCDGGSLWLRKRA